MYRCVGDQLDESFGSRNGVHARKKFGKETPKQRPPPTPSSGSVPIHARPVQGAHVRVDPIGREMLEMVLPSTIPGEVRVWRFEVNGL